MQKIAGLIAVPVLILVVASSAARADDKKADDKRPPGPPPKVKVYDFSGDTIEGDLIRPDGSIIGVPTDGKHSSLIRIRTAFIPEILKSAEDL